MKQTINEEAKNNQGSITTNNTNLDTLEEALMEEIQFLRISNKENTLGERKQRQNITLNLVKVASAVIATENLKERRFQNKLIQHSEARKTKKLAK